MCFRWLKTLYHCLCQKCSRRNRGYSREISLSHGGFCTGAFSNRHGRASFSCGREGSITYTRRPSSCPPPSSIPGGYPCDPHGAVVVAGGDGAVASGWDVAVGTVPAYGAGVGMGYGLGPVVVSHGGDLGVAGGGYGYSAPLAAGGVAEGSGDYGGGLGYGVGTFPGAELGAAGGGCAQGVQQQQCPVVVPPVKSQQCKQSLQWPPVQKK